MVVLFICLVLLFSYLLLQYWKGKQYKAGVGAAAALMGLPWSTSEASSRPPEEAFWLVQVGYMETC
jgi:hypothetical protein